MSQPTEADIVTEALDILQRKYKWWLKLRLTTHHERELARMKLARIEAARRELDLTVGAGH